ncbi:hypothetical protein DY000_02050700 [Brassica cretica]|uniref:Arginyl-tRNA synthetase catalytic core domain-containing protein n=1 Tax=Brassica cretica TaxID=69181 RepID=A0ABQ7ESR6_BRACR|nr:hypothetical protein DY000_02050700 [Brassica cretica]
MHVGQMRSTIMGDAIARMLEYSNVEVLLINHVGDWGHMYSSNGFVNFENRVLFSVIQIVLVRYPLVTYRSDADTRGDSPNS